MCRASQPTRRARVAAIGVATNALSFCAYSLGLLLVNLGVAIVTGSDKIPERPDYVESSEWAAGFMPLLLPWWVFLLFPVCQAALLGMVWDSKDYYAADYSRRFVIFASPFAIGCLGIAGAAFTFRVGDYYVGYGPLWLWLIPIAANLGVTAAAYVRTWQNETTSSQKRTRKPATRGTGGAKRESASGARTVLPPEQTKTDQRARSMRRKSGEPE